jgi:hypothetical protein
MDDKALLGNDSVKQEWKGSDRCYAIAQYTGVNNGVEDVFCGRCGGYITSMKPVTEQSSDNWEVGQFSTSQHEDSFQLEFEVVNSVTVNISRDISTKQDSELGLGAHENRRSASVFTVKLIL